MTIDLFDHSHAISDLSWSWMISRLTLLKSSRQVRNFDIEFTLFIKVLNLTLFSYFWTLVTLRPVFFTNVTSTALSWFNLLALRNIWKLTQNDLKFDIWPQTKIFWIKIILTSHWSFWAIVRKYQCNLRFFIKKNKSKPEIVQKNRKLETVNRLYRSVWPLENALL